MQSGKSWFSMPLFRKNLTRFWPIWGLYLVIWLFAFPIHILLYRGDITYLAGDVVLENVGQFGLFTAFTFSIAAAMAVWSYLYNSKSVGMIHTLPVRRQGLFLTNYLSGLAVFVGPNVLIVLLTLLAEASKGVVNVSAILIWLLGVTLMDLFFFSFATFCAMFTGHILCLPIFYGILNILVSGIVGLLEMTMGSFVFGYTGVEGLWTLADWLTPVWKLLNNLWIHQRANGPWLMGLGYIIVYAFFGLILAALALLAYHRRELERAGDVVTVAWVRPVFQYGVAFCCALAFGTALYTMFRYSLPEGAWTLLAFMLLCGAIGYFLARMLLDKTFRVFHAWKGCVCFLAALVLLTCVMEFDLFGYERRVPSADEVELVQLSWVLSAPHDQARMISVSSEDAEIIQAVTELHKAVTRNKNMTQLDRLDSYTSGFYVSYRLKNGHHMRRDYEYCVFVNDEQLADPDSAAAKLEALINLPQVIWQGYELEGTSAEQVVSLALSYCVVDTENGGDYFYDDLEIPREDWETLYNAVIADFSEGGLGRRYLDDFSQERQENCYVNDLEFVFYVEGNSQRPNESAPTTRRITIGLQTTAAHTRAALESLGILNDEVQLITHAQLVEILSQEENEGTWTDYEYAR